MTTTQIQGINIGKRVFVGEYFKGRFDARFRTCTITIAAVQNLSFEQNNRRAQTVSPYVIDELLELLARPAAMAFSISLSIPSTRCVLNSSSVLLIISALSASSSSAIDSGLLARVLLASSILCPKRSFVIFASIPSSLLNASANLSLSPRAH